MFPIVMSKQNGEVVLFIEKNILETNAISQTKCHSSVQNPSNMIREHCYTKLSRKSVPMQGNLNDS
jgi:hypothetical protein